MGNICKKKRHEKQKNNVIIYNNEDNIDSRDKIIKASKINNLNQMIFINNNDNNSIKALKGIGESVNNTKELNSGIQAQNNIQLRANKKEKDLKKKEEELSYLPNIYI